MTGQSNFFIGAVVYCPGIEPGTLDAYWVRSTEKSDMILKGWATGGPTKGLVGDYSIIYYDGHGNPSKPFDLRIDLSGEIFHLKWSQKGKQIYQGIGMLRDGTIVAGWAPV